MAPAPSKPLPRADQLDARRAPLSVQETIAKYVNPSRRICCDSYAYTETIHDEECMHYQEDESGGAGKEPGGRGGEEAKSQGDTMANLEGGYDTSDSEANDNAIPDRYLTEEELCTIQDHIREIGEHNQRIADLVQRVLRGYQGQRIMGERDAVDGEVEIEDPTEALAEHISLVMEARAEQTVADNQLLRLQELYKEQDFNCAASRKGKV